MAWVKKVAKKAEKKVFGSGGIKGRYGIGKGKGGFKIMKLAKDLEMVKSRLNVEKKFVDTDVQTTIVGQAYGSTEGAYYRDITPLIPQGITDNERIGNSVRITGLSMPLQFRGQTNCLNARKFRITVAKVRNADNGVSAQEAFERIWDINPMNGLRDYNAPRAYRNSKTDGISIVYSKTCYLKAPALDNGALGLDSAEASIKDMRVNLKLNDVLRFRTDASTGPSGFSYMLFIQCDAGNSNTSVSGSFDIPTNSVATGCDLRVHTRYWYVDN